jgi:hypothetical protein
MEGGVVVQSGGGKMGGGKDNEGRDGDEVDGKRGGAWVAKGVHREESVERRWE